MTSPEQHAADEWRRLASASSLADAVAERVDDLAQIPPEDLPAWLTELGVPRSWRIAHFADPSGVAPSRIAVCGGTPNGGWDGCETITLLRFTGMPGVDVVRDNAECTLRDLDAKAVTTRLLATPPLSGWSLCAAVDSSARQGNRCGRSSAPTSPVPTKPTKAA